MRLIHIDIETQSAANLPKVGIYNYADDPSTRVLCLCFKVHGETEVQTWLPGQSLPAIFQIDASYTCIAHNASFERLIIEKILHPQFGFPLPKSYICTMATVASNGYPLSLEAAAQAMNLDAKKDREGAFLMRKLCKGEAKPTHEDLSRLAAYCIQDVVVESSIYDRLSITPTEQRAYEVDQLINDRGIQIDTESVKSIIKAIDVAINDLTVEIQEITDGEVQSPGQVMAIREWLSTRNVWLFDLRAETVENWLRVAESEDLYPPECRRVLEIRQAASLASLKKYPAMLVSACSDGRARGLFLFCGAMSTGRWTSRRIQLQNLARLSLSDGEVKVAIQKFCERDLTGLRLFIGEPLDVAKELLRPMLFSDRGLVVGDYSSIELRVSAWLAGEVGLLQELRNGDDSYESMASVIYGVPLAEVTKEQRQIGKVAILGCGYSMGWLAFFSTLRKYGIAANEELAERAVKAYRIKHPQIVSTWYALSDAALAAVDQGGPQSVGKYLKFAYRGGTLAMRLPSGRLLKYHQIQVVEGKYGRELTCASFDLTKNDGRKKLYGGLFFENACQAVARDLLAETLVRGTDAGYEIVAHVHDEIVIEGSDDVAAIQRCMEVLPAWANGLPVQAKVFSCAGADGRYTK